MGDGPRPGKARGIGPTGASNEPGPKFTRGFSPENAEIDTPIFTRSCNRPDAPEDPPPATKIKIN